MIKTFYISYKFKDGYGDLIWHSESKPMIKELKESLSASGLSEIVITFIYETTSDDSNPKL